MLGSDLAGLAGCRRCPRLGDYIAALPPRRGGKAERNRFWTAWLLSAMPLPPSIERLRLRAARRSSAFRSEINMNYLPELGNSRRTGPANKPMQRYLEIPYRYEGTAIANRTDLIRGRT